MKGKFFMIFYRAMLCYRKWGVEFSTTSNKTVNSKKIFKTKKQVTFFLAAAAVFLDGKMDHSCW